MGGKKHLHRQCGWPVEVYSERIHQLSVLTAYYSDQKERRGSSDRFFFWYSWVIAHDYSVAELNVLCIMEGRTDIWTREDVGTK